jgi:hypothetical protein
MRRLLGQTVVADRGARGPGPTLTVAGEYPAHLAYRQANRRAGRYVGEIRFALDFPGVKEAFSGWLHVGGALFLPSRATSG